MEKDYLHGSCGWSFLFLLNPVFRRNDMGVLKKLLINSFTRGCRTICRNDIGNSDPDNDVKLSLKNEKIVQHNRVIKQNS